MLLVLTSRAVATIGDLVGASVFDQTTAGLRIWAEPEADPPIGLGVAALPGEDDELVEAHGVRIFVQPAVRTYLSRKVLDASMSGAVAIFELSDREA